MTLIYKNIEDYQYIQNWSLCCRLFQVFLCVCVVDVEVLYHSQMAFGSRLYGPLDVDLTRIKLHEPMSVIIQQPLLYVRDMVPKPCFEALVKLNQVGTATGTISLANEEKPYSMAIHKIFFVL